MSSNPGIPTDLPDENFLLDRMAASENLRAGLSPVLANISKLALRALSSRTSIPFPSQIQIQEATRYSGKVDFIVPRFWPVQQIMQAVVGGSTQNLRIGSEIMIARGQADIAIKMPDREVIRCGANVGGYGWGGYGVGAGVDVFLTYRAGMDGLPPDLLEVYSELALLMFKEKDRIGQNSVKIDVGLLNYTRKLPDWARASLETYRRIAVYA